MDGDLGQPSKRQKVSTSIEDNFWAMASQLPSELCANYSGSSDAVSLVDSLPAIGTFGFPSLSDCFNETYHTDGISYGATILSANQVGFEPNYNAYEPESVAASQTYAEFIASLIPSPVNDRQPGCPSNSTVSLLPQSSSGNTEQLPHANSQELQQVLGTEKQQDGQLTIIRQQLPMNSPQHIPRTSSDCHQTDQQLSSHACGGSNVDDVPLAEKISSPSKAADLKALRLKMIGRQLALLLHAIECQRLESGVPGASRCDLPFCSTMKSVLSHRHDCMEGFNCPVDHCFSTGQIVTHWQNCTDSECQVCKPYLQAERLIHYQNQHELGNDTNYDDHVEQLQSIVPLPYSKPAVGPNQTFEPPHHSLSSQSTVVKDWHAATSKELRSHLAIKLVKAIHPRYNPNVAQPHTVDYLVNYSKRIENDTFNSANSSEEYYHTLAQKMFEFGKNRGIKKNIRLESNRSEDMVVRQVQIPLPYSSDTLNQVEPYRLDATNSGSRLVSKVNLESNQAFPKLPLPQASVTNLSSKPVLPSVAGTSSGASYIERVLKVIKPDELRQALLPSLKALYNQEYESSPFREPVDPKALRLFDYYDIVKKPMDLSTIEKKLDTGQYRDPWQYVDDIWLMFDNALLYNGKNSRVYRYAVKLSAIFETEIDGAMRSLGYCCGHKYTFRIKVLMCSGKQSCSIRKDAVYMSYDRRITYCANCFSNISGDIVVHGFQDLGTNATSQQHIPKSEFITLKNDQPDIEPFVNCCSCDRKFHQICVGHMELIYPEGFTCKVCLDAKMQSRPTHKFTAISLPQSKLSNHIEARLNRYLKVKCADASPVFIRIVTSAEKSVDVKPEMAKHFVTSGKWPKSFPYREKAVFAFQEVNGTDVCFFGMYVQEYGSDCPPPNTRRVYISYLDSIQYFEPKKYRTAVYYEILLGYLDYVKQIGYSIAHVWACPPLEGDDYIFHCHPPEQKLPRHKRLQEWYKKMLDKGISERIVLDYKDVFEQANEDNVKSVMDLPYFEGDFWPIGIEDLIRDTESQMAKLNTSNSTPTRSQTSEVASLSSKASSSKAHSIKRGSNKRIKCNDPEPSCQSFDDLLTKNILAKLEKNREIFFVVKLHSNVVASALPPITDADYMMNCDLNISRETFLSMCKTNHYEFSSLRRAKWSSLFLLYELYNSYWYHCNVCKKPVVEARYNCTECDDFDLCPTCFIRIGHPHRVEKIVDVGDTLTGVLPVDSTVAREQVLVHCCHCNNISCRLPSCHKMKQIIKQWRAYTAADTSNSTFTKSHSYRQFIALCAFHMKRCNDSACLVPNCYAARQQYGLKKYRLYQQKLQLKSKIASGTSDEIEPAVQSQMDYDSGHDAKQLPIVCGSESMATFSGDSTAQGSSIATPLSWQAGKYRKLATYSASYGQPCDKFDMAEFSSNVSSIGQSGGPSLQEAFNMAVSYLRRSKNTLKEKQQIITIIKSHALLYNMCYKAHEKQQVERRQKENQNQTG